MKALAEVLTDVSLREGSQQDIDLRSANLATKLQLLELILKVGIKSLELTALAPGAWFSDAENLITQAPMPAKGTKYRALYFNSKGLKRMLEFPKLSREGIFHTALTHNYRSKNYRQDSSAITLEKLTEFLAAFKENKLAFDTLVLSTAWGEEGEVTNTEHALNFFEKLNEHSTKSGFPIKSLTLADTVGAASPSEILRMFKAFKANWPKLTLRAHLHPKQSLALESIHAAIEGGVDEWEATWAGLGGSPFADKPGGNLDIRMLIQVYKDKGFEVGLNLAEIPKLIDFLKLHIKRSVTFAMVV